MAQTIIFVPVTTPDAAPSGTIVFAGDSITSVTGVAQNFVRTCKLMGLNDAQTIQQLGQDWTNGAYVSFLEG
jgi:hypothetical protein